MILNFNTEKTFEYENGFMLTSEVYRLGNFLAHYELYKKIIDLPGDVIELGVFKGNSLIQFASYRELLENEKSRKIIGFDAFGSFPSNKTNTNSDEEFISNWNKQFENQYLSDQDLYNSLNLKNISNVDLIKGDILDTLPKYLEQHPFTKVSLLHIDTDVYAPSKVGLELLFDRVVAGGVIVFDDYGTVEGETKAIDEFLENKGYTINKFSFSHVKPSFIIKK
ncbi:TylF/MycF/NovP-related O-methyltransferase [Lysinibacillus sp. NPDC097279]|uniref:TylF/MycF/NovP-related O-methyltransferase n=1 Tax=Lysinibacillus sp. NPDC097279 TaxID=3364143 RepID=UPI00380AE2EC